MEEDRARWAELLATSLQVSGLSETEIERKLGWSPGSLGQLLEGEGDLEPDQVLEILGELNESSLSKRRAGPTDRDLGDGRTQVVSELLDRFRLLGYEQREAPPPAPEASSLKELERKVESILRRAYGDPPRQEED